MNKIAQRFVDVWKADFLAKFVSREHKDMRTTVIFWICFNAFIAVVLSIGFAIFLFGLQGEILTSLNTHVPDGATVNKSLGQLSIENVDEPIFREINAENTRSGDAVESFVFIVDTESQAYDITSLDPYTGGILVLHDRAYVKDGTEINTIIYTDVPDFSVTKEQVVKFVRTYFFFPVAMVLVCIAFTALMIFYGVIRLVVALWWALMLFVLAKIMSVSLRYSVAYKAVLNFYVIPTLIMFIISFTGVHVPLLVTTIFLVIFVMNLLWIKRQKKEGEEEEVSVKQGNRSQVSEAPEATPHKTD